MRTIFLLLALHAYSLNAQNTYSKIQYRIDLDHSYCMPLGAFAAGHNNNFFAGQCTATSGASFSMGVKFANHFACGVHFSSTTYKAKKDKLYDQLLSKYGAANYYTSIVIDNPSYKVVALSLEGSYVFDFRFMEVEPYLLAGASYDMNEDNYLPVYGIHRKEKGGNYSEDINATMQRSPFLFPGGGLRVSKKIWKAIYAHAGIQYNYGVSEFTINDKKSDFLNNRSYSTQSYSQPVSVLQINAGVEMRFRGKHRQKKSAVK